MSEHARLERPSIEITDAGHDERLYAELLFEDLAGGNPDETITQHKLKEANGRRAEYYQRDATEFLIRQFLKRAGWSIEEEYEHDRSSGGQGEGIYEVHVEKLVPNPLPEWGGEPFIVDGNNHCAIRFHYRFRIEEGRLHFLPTDVRVFDKTDAYGERFISAPNEISAPFNRTYTYRIPQATIERARASIEAERRRKEENLRTIQRIKEKAIAYSVGNGKMWKMTRDVYDQDRDVHRVVLWPDEALEMTIEYRDDPNGRGPTLECAFYGKGGIVVDIFAYPLI